MVDRDGLRDEPGIVGLQAIGAKDSPHLLKPHIGNHPRFWGVIHGFPASLTSLIKVEDCCLEASRIQINTRRRQTKMGMYGLPSPFDAEFSDPEACWFSQV